MKLKKIKKSYQKSTSSMISNRPADRPALGGFGILYFGKIFHIAGCKPHTPVELGV